MRMAATAPKTTPAIAPGPSKGASLDRCGAPKAVVLCVAEGVPVRAGAGEFRGLVLGAAPKESVGVGLAEGVCNAELRAVGVAEELDPMPSKDVGVSLAVVVDEPVLLAKAGAAKAARAAGHSCSPRSALCAADPFATMTSAQKPAHRSMNGYAPSLPMEECWHRALQAGCQLPVAP